MKKPQFLKTRKKNAFYVDAFSRQLTELFFVNNPHFARDKAGALMSQEYKVYLEKNKNNFIYIYFDWTNTVVKCVKKADYLKLKTNRNINLISPRDQEKLRNYKIGVFGMSVGSNIAYLLTQAGISNDIVIADYDELDTTNLNRIWGGVHQIGINKAHLVARKIYEDNPYANITVLDKGITIPTLEKLLKAKKISCIVEEVDAMPIKVEVRKKAMEYKVPVITIADNGDGVVLSVERYDLGYKKMYEKGFEYWDKRVANSKSPKDFADIVINDMIGGIDKVDKRMIESVKMLYEGKLVSWPQLGSAAMLGAVVVTNVVKGIVRGTDQQLFRREYVRVI